MHRTLFHIPREVFEPQHFGFSWLLVAWTIFSIALLIWVVRKQGFRADTWGHVLLLLLVGAVIRFVLPALCKSQGLPIHGYGVMLLLGVVSGVAMAVWRGRRVGVDPELIFTLSFWAFVPGIIGARAFYVIEYWSGFQRSGNTLLAMINVTEGGLVVYGSVIGGALGLVGFFAKYKMPPLATLDLITPSFLLGLAVGRIGCLLNGCCFGGPCDLPWAVTFPAGSPAHVHQVRSGQTFLHGLKIVGAPDAEPVIAEVRPNSPAEKQGLRGGQKIHAINGRPVGTVDHAQWALIRAGRTGSEITVATAGSASVARWRLPTAHARSEPVHPTQLYSAANALVLCLFLLAYAPLCRRDGEVWAMFLTVYPVTRFLLEIIRTDEPGMFGTGLSISQNLSLLLLLGAIIFWAQLRMRPPGTVFATYREPSKKGSEAAEE